MVQLFTIVIGLFCAYLTGIIVGYGKRENEINQLRAEYAALLSFKEFNK